MRRVIALSLALVTIALIDESGAAKKKASPELQAWRENTVGREFWLRTNVIRVQGTLKGTLKATDATNVFPDGRVYHQGTISRGVQISAQTPAEFTDEARRKLGFDKEQNAATILTMEKGARIYVHGVEFNKKQVKVKLTLKGDWYSTIRTTIRLKLAEGYTVEDVEQSFAVALPKRNSRSSMRKRQTRSGRECLPTR